MAYASTAELKARISKTGNADDTSLAALLSAAEEAINNYCHRPDGFEADSTATARLYAAHGKPYVLIDECIAITTVAVKDSATDTTYTAWAATDWIAFSGDPENPEFNRLPYDGIMSAAGGDYDIFLSGKFTTLRGFRPSSSVARSVPMVQVTAKWGYSVNVPAVIKEACILQAARWWKRAESSWADSIANGDMGSLQFRKVLDPDFQMMLKEGRLIRPALGYR